MRGERRLSVWVTGQKQARGQRTGRYTRLSFEHPGKMLPAIARHAVEAFTEPGEVVLDPMCGIGTTLVEAVHLGRGAVGVELEPKWASIARLNTQIAATQGAPGTARVVTGDARTAMTGLACELAGRVALVVTSPPYGAMTHGQIRTRREGGAERKVNKTSHLYTATRDATNLAYQKPDELLESFTQILRGCRPLLRPGGVVAITARPYRVRGELVDFPGQVAAAAERAGLVLVDRCVALLCALRGDGLVSRGSFFQTYETRRLRERGVPARLISHEDVLILTNPAPGHAAPHVRSVQPAERGAA